MTFPTWRKESAEGENEATAWRSRGPRWRKRILKSAVVSGSAVVVGVCYLSRLWKLSLWSVSSDQVSAPCNRKPRPTCRPLSRSTWKEAVGWCEECGLCNQAICYELGSDSSVSTCFWKRRFLRILVYWVVKCGSHQTCSFYHLEFFWRETEVK